MNSSSDQQDHSVQLLMAEYGTLSRSFWEIEQLGDRRVNFFITLTTSFISAFGIVKQVQSIIPVTSDSIVQVSSNSEIFTIIIILSVLGILFFYGFFTLARLIRRKWVHY
jgi:uncharacterized Tic20 family protein